MLTLIESRVLQIDITLLEAHRLRVQIRFSASSGAEYEAWVGTQGKRRYLVSILGRTLTAAHLSNVLDIRDGVVTGEVPTAIVDGDRKARYLAEIAKAEGISMEQVIAVGDGANDLPMLRLAGLGIAFRAKPLVRQRANNRSRPWALTGSCTCWA